MFLAIVKHTVNDKERTRVVLCLTPGELAAIARDETFAFVNHEGHSGMPEEFEVMVKLELAEEIAIINQQIAIATPDGDIAKGALSVPEERDPDAPALPDISSAPPFGEKPH